MRHALFCLIALMCLAAVPPSTAKPLMQWPDLLNRPLPQANERIPYGPGQSQFAELWLPRGRGPFPVVLMVHGGCWNSHIAHLSIMNYIAEDLRRRGVAVWNIEYSGADQASGGYPGTFLDVARGADALRDATRTYPLRLRHIVAFGHSAGGHLVLWLAARSHLAPGSALFARNPLMLDTVIS